MSSNVANSPAVITRTVSMTPIATIGKLGTVTAPDVEGYTFVAWVAASTEKFITAAKCEFNTQKTTDVFTAVKTGPDTVQPGYLLNVVALYVRT